MMKKRDNIVLIIALCSLFLGIFSLINLVNKNKKLETINNLYKTSQDSLIIERNKYNQEVAKTTVLQSENSKLFTKLDIKDQDIIRLQKVVRNYEKKIGDLNTAIVISNETILHLKDSLQATIIGYTSSIDSPKVIYPIYKRKFTRDWDSGEIIVGISQLELSIKIKNNYDITVGNERINLFKHKYYANITNLNPNTETKTIKVYQKELVKTNIGKHLAIGSIAGFLIALIII